MRKLEREIMQKLTDFQARGTIAVAIDRAGNVLYEGNWGYADVEQKRKLNDDTIMGIASMSKSFVAIGIMQLVERGILELGTTVATYIPELVGAQQEQITVGQLLYHSGGFPMLHRTTVYEVLEDLGRVQSGVSNYPKDVSTDDEVATAGFAKIVGLLNGVTDFVFFF